MLTPKQEAFAMAYVETGNASEAYRRAYPKSRHWKPQTVHARASELLANGKVLVRVNELKAEHRRRHGATVDDILAELDETRQAATAEGQHGVARQCSMDKAKLLFDRALPILRTVDASLTQSPHDSDLVRLGQALVAAMLAGDVAPVQARDALGVLRAQAELQALADIERRLTELEERLT